MKSYVLEDGSGRISVVLDSETNDPLEEKDFK
jgi:hypothetical protein